MTFDTLLVTDAAPFAAITLNRPQKNNAMNFRMIDDLLAAFAVLRDRADIRAVTISGAGGNFCAGGDLADMLAIAADHTADEQAAILARMDTLLHTVQTAPQVVIAKVAGTALGGGFGLVCAADIAIASTTAVMGMPEARLGLAPSLIAPYVIGRIGLTRARLLMLTGGQFDGVSAHEYGVVQEVCPPDTLDECAAAILTDLRACSPAALRAIKELIFTVTNQSTAATVDYRVRLLNSLRFGTDAQEGLTARMAKRKPNWAVES